MDMASILRALKANQKEIDDMPKTKRAELGKRNGWRGYSTGNAKGPRTKST